VFAFARDRGLPFSGIFSKVESKKKVPINAILLTALVQIAFNSIYFGTLTGFETVITVATEGFCKYLPCTKSWTLTHESDLSYAMPLLARLLSRMRNETRVLTGPYTLGRYGLWLNLIGFIFLTYNCITFNFPTVSCTPNQTICGHVLVFFPSVDLP
jgi:choline transport protein